MSPVVGRRWPLRAAACLSALATVLVGCAGPGPKHHHHNALSSPSIHPSQRAKPHHHRVLAGPPLCPLRGTPAPHGRVPRRRALGIKVENLPAARPQTGLDHADIVYEEPVEDMITRFIVVFQCYQAARVEPVRSGRLVDPDILVQFGHPLMGYAGAIGPVIHKIDHSGVIDESYDVAVGAYFRDPSRFAPHNLYTSTAKLWRDGPRGGPPQPVFKYSRQLPRGAVRQGLVHIDFSSYSNVYWRYDRRLGVYRRYYDGNVPAMLSDGHQISATNVIVQRVKMRYSRYSEDVNGVHEWAIQVVGLGRATVYRSGYAIHGWWFRARLHHWVTHFFSHHHAITLKPGVTWVELVPTWVAVSSH